MRRFNVLRDELAANQSRDGFSWARARIGDKLGTRAGSRENSLTFRRLDAVDCWDGE